MNQSDFQGELKAELEDELERLHPASFGWALFCCDRRREEAEEVLQTAYLKVLDGRASFNGWSSLRTWFFAVIRRTAWEQRRRRWLRENLLGGWVKREPTMPRAADPEILLSLSENAEAVRKDCARVLRGTHKLSAVSVGEREVGAHRDGLSRAGLVLQTVPGGCHRDGRRCAHRSGGARGR